MVLFILSLPVLLRLFFGGTLLTLAWSRPDLPLLSNLAGPIQHFQAAILDVWRNKVAADLCGREGFRGGPLLDIHGSLQLLNSSHVRERDKALLKAPPPPPPPPPPPVSLKERQSKGYLKSLDFWHATLR